MRHRVIIILLTLLADCHAVGPTAEQSTRHYKDVLLTRRVRSLIFPNKAMVLLTPAMTKVIVGARPSGLQYSLEFDMYVPLPDTIEGWRPKVLKKLKHKTVAKPAQRWDSYYTSGASQYNYTQPSEQAAEEFDRYSFYNTPRSLAKFSTLDDDQHVYESWSDVPSWKLHRGYRERRTIFEQLEALGVAFKLDLRSCIKRAMCEFRARLNAQKGSGLLMEDLVRIILTVPDEITDNRYRHRVDIHDCERFYAPSCPYRVLDILTSQAKKRPR